MNLSDSETLRLFGLLLEVTEDVEVLGIKNDFRLYTKCRDNFNCNLDTICMGRGDNFQLAIMEAISWWVSKIASAIGIGTLLHPYHWRASRCGRRTYIVHGIPETID